MTRGVGSGEWVVGSGGHGMTSGVGSGECAHLIDAKE